MTLVVKRPNTLTSAFDQLFDEFFRGDLPFSNGGRPAWRPAVNVIETPASFRLELAAPGLDKSDFGIDVDKNILTISAHKEAETREGETIRVREFGAVRFERSFRLPETIDVSAIEARYESGILRIELPKREEAREKPARRIEIA